METSGISAASAAQASATNSKVSLADNFDSFLKLLTTQLQSQDPMAPMDASQFTQQLVQFSDVEQSIKSNSTLAQLVSLMQADQSVQAVDYLGATVEVNGSAIQLDATSQPHINYQLDQAASSVTITIRDAQGNMVASRTGEATAGQHSMRWDGLGLNQRRAPEGLYQVEVKATGHGGQAVKVSTTTTGVVDAVEIQSGRLMLSVGGVMVPADALLSVSRPTSSSTSTSTTTNAGNGSAAAASAPAAAASSTDDAASDAATTNTTPTGLI